LNWYKKGNDFKEEIWNQTVCDVGSVTGFRKMESKDFSLRNFSLTKQKKLSMILYSWSLNWEQVTNQKRKSQKCGSTDNETQTSRQEQQRNSRKTCESQKEKKTQQTHEGFKRNKPGSGHPYNKLLVFIRTSTPLHFCNFSSFKQQKNRTKERGLLFLFQTLCVFTLPFKKPQQTTRYSKTQ